MWARLVKDGIEVHRDSEPKPPDGLDVTDQRPAFNPATEELAGPSWKKSGGRVVAVYEVVARDHDRDERNARQQRIAAVADKARTILANPSSAADWTPAERKLILAALVVANLDD